MPFTFSPLSGKFDYYKAPITDHGAMTGLLDDDHTIYALLAGRAGGQTLIGDTASGGNLTLQSTSNATKGKILFGTSAYDEANNYLGLGTNTPGTPIHIVGTTDIQSVFWVENKAASSPGAGGGARFSHNDGAAMASGDRLGWVIFGGAEDASNTLHYPVSYHAKATENWSATANGAAIAFETTENGTTSRVERMKIDHNGNILINGFSAATVGLTVKGAVSQSANLQEWQNSAGTVLDIIDASGRVGIGISTIRSNAGAIRKLNIEGDSTNVATVSMIENVNDIYGSSIILGKTRSTVVGGVAIVQNGDYLGNLIFTGCDGVDMDNVGARISSFVDGTPASDKIPANIIFYTKSDSATALSERLRITSAGLVGINDTTPDAQLDVQSSGAAVIGQIIQGAASQTADLLQILKSDGTVYSKFNNIGNLFLAVKSGATQAGAGAAAGEVWKTASHATLPDNVLMIGV